MRKTGDTIRIVAIIGTSRPANFTSKVLALAIDELNAQPDVEVTTIDPSDLTLPFPGQPGEFPDQALLQAMVKQADGAILATPEYNGTFAAMMKLMIENLGSPSPLAGKPVALLGVAAGRIGAIKSLEHLRSVASHIGAIVLPNPISVASVNTLFDEQGSCLDEATEQAIRGLSPALLDYLTGRRHPIS